jgi:hypothetical protein
LILRELKLAMRLQQSRFQPFQLGLVQIVRPSGLLLESATPFLVDWEESNLRSETAEEERRGLVEVDYTTTQPS